MTDHFVLRARPDNSRRGSHIERMRRSRRCSCADRSKTRAAARKSRAAIRERSPRPWSLPSRSVAELRRKQKMRRRRIVFEGKASRDLLVEQIVIVVIKTGDTECELLADQPPVSQFVAVELFRREVGIGIESGKFRQPARADSDETRKVEVFFGVGWSSQGVRKGRPDCLLSLKASTAAGRSVRTRNR